MPAFSNLKKTLTMFFDNINEDYTALYIHNKTQSNNLEDCVFYYKADPIPPDFKFGCQDFWGFHNEEVQFVIYRSYCVISYLSSLLILKEKISNLVVGNK